MGTDRATRADNRRRLAPMLEPVTECIGQVGHAVNLVRGFLDIVLDTPVGDRLLIHVEHDVAGTFVVVPRSDQRYPR